MTSFTLALGLIAFSAPAAVPVVVSTDCGAEVDDQWALAHLALSPEINLKGVVTTHAPGLRAPAAESSAEVAREVFAKIGLKTPPPVLAGSSEPLGSDRKPRDNPGVRFLIESSKGHSKDTRLTIVMIGAATDVASALLIDPSWADRVRIVAMAFEGWPDGGDPWNVKNDVKAWQIVMSSSVPLVVGDARVTRRRLLQAPDTAFARFGGKGTGGDYLVSVLSAWLARNGKMAQSVTGSRDSWPIWDEVTVAFLLGFTTQDERPRPSLDTDRTLNHTHPRGTITWITNIDNERLWDDLAKKLK